MKKTVIALAIAAMAATSANAATVYEQDGTKVELGGSLRIFLGKNANKLGGDSAAALHTGNSQQRGDLINDGSRVTLKVSHKLSDDVKAFVGYELRFKAKDNVTTNEDGSDSEFGGVQTKKLYGGFDFANVGAVSFGRQATTADDVVGDSLYFRSGLLNPLTTGADKSVKFRSAEFAGFSFGVDYLFGHAKKYDGNDYKNGYQAGLFYNYEIAENHAVDFAAVYAVDQYDDKTTSDTVLKKHQWAVATHYKLDGLQLGAAYGQIYNRYQESGLLDTKGQYVFVEAKYNLKDVTGIPTTFGLQWERLSEKADTADAPSVIKNQYIAVVDYKFNKNVLPYVQYARASLKDVNERRAENVYGVGLRVYF